MALLSDLTHPLTNTPVELYDPTEHDSAEWHAVTCTDCLRHYVCAPWDDLNTPAPELGWTNGDVCDMCLLRMREQRVPS